MTNGQSSVGRDRDRSDNGIVAPPPVEASRTRVTSRRRRARQDRRRSATWIAGRSRRRTVRTLAVCAGALLLMALGLYFGLEHQESRGSLEGAVPVAVGAVGIV